MSRDRRRVALIKQIQSRTMEKLQQLERAAREQLQRAAESPWEDEWEPEATVRTEFKEHQP